MDCVQGMFGKDTAEAHWAAHHSQSQISENKETPGTEETEHTQQTPFKRISKMGPKLLGKRDYPGAWAIARIMKEVNVFKIQKTDNFVEGKRRYQRSWASLGAARH